MNAKISRLFVTAGILFSGLVYAQQPTVEWIRTYHGPSNGGGISKVICDNDGNIIVTGKNAGSGSALDIATIKYNSAGDTLWVRRYGNGAECSVDGIVADASDNIYITGFTVIGGQPKSITVKYDPAGNIIWQKLYDSTPDNRSIGIGFDQQGFIYVAGSANKNGTDWGVEVVKYNPANGDTIWTARYDQTSNSIDIPYAMTVDQSGNVYVTGYSQAAGIQAMLVKFNSSGQLQWETLYSIPSVAGDIQGRAVKVDNDGNVYVAGHCYSGQTTFVDFLILKCNADGDTVWVNGYSSSASIDEANDIAVDNDGNIYVTGRTFAGGGGSNNYDYLTLKLSQSGTVLWHSTYDGPAVHTEDEARAIRLDGNGDCIVTGGSSIGPLYYSGEFATVMYDADGNEVWALRNSSGDFGAYDMAIDNNNNIYLGGGETGGFCTIKINSGIIPIELVSFNIKSENDRVMLNWLTATEINNKGFEIERRSDKWEMIGFVSGFGTTTESHSYTFTDTDPNTGRNTYRLRQVDFDGSFVYSNELEIDVNLPAQYFLDQNFPNPFNPNTTINFSLPVEARVTVKIFNALGEEINRLTDNNYSAGFHSINFNADALASGLYIYSIDAVGIDNTTYRSVKKMMVLK